MSTICLYDKQGKEWKACDSTDTKAIQEHNIKIGNYVTLGDNVTKGRAIIDFVLPFAGTRHTIVYYWTGEISIDCHRHTIQEWLENYAEIGKKHGYTPEEIEEYRGYIEAIALLHNERKK